jgi:hypothetical protein
MILVHVHVLFQLTSKRSASPRMLDRSIERLLIEFVHDGVGVSGCLTTSAGNRALWPAEALARVYDHEAWP